MPPNDAPPEGELVEVFHTSSRVAAHKVVFLLVRQGIEGGIHDRMDSAFPAGPNSGSLYIAVAGSQAEQARAILADAATNGVIDGEDGEAL